MARHIEQIQLDKPDDFVLSVMNTYLQKNGFVVSDLKNESVYRAGHRFTDGYRYLKWSYSEGALKLEAWIRGPFGCECSLKGPVYYDKKVLYKDSLAELLMALKQQINLQPVEHNKSAMLSLLFGILAFAAFNPLLCIVFAPIAITLAEIGLRSRRTAWARGGRICAIVSLLTTSIVCFMNLYLQFI